MAFYDGLGAGFSNVLGTFGKAYSGTPMGGEPARATFQQGLMGGEGKFLAQALRDQALGRGPSVAQQQMMVGRDNAIGAAMKAAASGRGATGALANQGAMQQAGQIGVTAARDAAILRAQEQMAALQGMGQLRQQDIDIGRAQLQADSARATQQFQGREGLAERRQKAAGGPLAALGSVLSDPNMKMNMQPAGFQQPAFQQPGIQQPAPQQPMMGSWSPQQFQALAGVTPQSQSQMNPTEFDRQVAESIRRQNGGPDAAQPQPQQSNGEQSTMDKLGGALQAWGGSLSGFETKQNIQPVPSGFDMKQNVAYPSASDPNAKMNVERFPNLAANVSPVIQEAANVGTYNYEYKPDAAAKFGEQVGQMYTGPMANRTPDSLENNSVYAPAVKYAPDGNAMVDPGRAAVTNIGVTSEIAREQMRQANDLANMKAAIMAELRGEKGMTQPAVHAQRSFGQNVPQRTREGAPPHERPDASGNRAGSPSFDPFNPARPDQLQPVPQRPQGKSGFQRERMVPAPGKRRDPNDQSSYEGTGTGRRMSEAELQGVTFHEPTDTDVTNEGYDMAVDDIYQQHESRPNMTREERLRLRQQKLSPDEKRILLDAPTPYPTGGREKMTALGQSLVDTRGEERTPAGPEREDALGDRAAIIQMSQRPNVRKEKIRDYEAVRRGGITDRVLDAEFVYQDLVSRGIKVKKSEVVDALRHETDL